MNVLEKIALAEVASYCNTTANKDGFISEVSTDSRKVGPETLFVALKGERFDGNDFVPEVLSKDVAAVLCSRSDLQDDRILWTDDTRRSLLALSGGYRAKFHIPVVAVTGSVGKTTTKGMIGCVLGRKFHTLVTEGNLNNEIGVPKMLLRLEKQHEAAVIEMGMNHYGEISALSGAVRPTMGVITNVGTAHIENFGSREGILKAKCEILDGMRLGSLLIVNGDNDLLSELSLPDYELVYFGIENERAFVRATDLCETAEGVRFTLRCGELSAKAFVPVVGRHNVYDALAAAAVGLKLGFSPEEIADALASFHPEGLRQKSETIHGVNVIADCYNANPDSMRASLSALCTVKKGRAVAVLGDMKELGDYSEKAHRDIGRICARLGLDAVFAYGSDAAFLAEEATIGKVPLVKCSVNKSEIVGALKKYLRAGDTALFKGSRSMKMEEVLKEWEE